MEHDPHKLVSSNFIIKKPSHMKTRAPKSPSVTSKKAGGSKVKAVRDNVLGRRPSKSDPLGEQPGTVAKNPELDVVKAIPKMGYERPLRAKKRS